MKIAALQLSTQPASNARMDYYLKLAKHKGVRLSVCGEYVINDFFLCGKSQEQIQQQSTIKMEFLSKFSAEYDMHIIAPFILIGKKGPIKALVHFDKQGYKIYEQQILMPYSHWDEAKYFANAKRKIKTPLIKIDDLKIALLPSFELHFDEIFAKCKADLGLVFCAHTFGSDQRWRSLISTRAFTHSMSMLRINRIGKYESKDGDWEFYGSSFLTDASGELQQELGGGEEMLICNVEKSNIASSFWRFERIRRELASR